jgi:hypothetical protein
MGKCTANPPAISLERLALYAIPFTLLTSSSEKANYYQFHLTKAKCKSSPTFIESPAIYSLPNWCIQAYKQQPDRMRVLTPEQRLDRFIHVIQSTTTISSMTDAIHIADTCAKLLYNIHIEDHSRDILKQRWVEPECSYYTLYRAYLASLASHREIDTLHAIRTITDTWMLETPPPSPQWIFDHPEQLPARYQRLYHHLHKQGIACALRSPAATTHYYRMTSFDPQLGYHDFIHWYKQSVQPRQVALAIPHLSSQITEIDRLVEHWQSHHGIPRSDIAIVAKRPLSTLCIAQTVFHLMALYQDVMSINTLIQLVSSPYVWSANRLDKNRLLHALEQLSSSNDRLCSPQSLRQQLRMISSLADCPITAALIQLLQYCHLPMSVPFFQHVQSALTLTQFPVALAPEEKKAYQLLNQLLLSIANTTSRLSPENGLIYFTALCQQTLVTEAHLHRPIQIIDQSQVTPGIYPYIWYANLDETQLASNTCDQIANLMQASPFIVLQYAQFAHGCTQNIAPSIQHYWQSATAIPHAPSRTIYPQKSVAQEPYLPTTSLPLATQEKHIGTYHLKTFQQCPFKAFARYRLQCMIPEPTQFGFSAKDRGIILHNILQNLFQAYPQSAVLATLQQDPTPINTLIQDQLAQAVGTRKLSLNASYLQSEQRRIRQLIDDYIALELTRPPFTVRFIEKRLQIPIHSLTINGIIDRVDESRAHYILIDYKTGQASHHEWFGDFLDPQLPCYAQYFRDQAVTASLALFTHSSIRYTGITHEDYPFFSLPSRYPNIGASWSEIQVYWQTTLYQVADQYQQGQLTLTTHRHKFCNNCYYQRLCRVWDTPGDATCNAP